jgi:hypothetical protein
VIRHTSGVVLCHDTNDDTYVWDVRGGKPKRFKLDRGKPPRRLTSFFSEVCPDISLKDLDAVSMRAERTNQPM